MTAGGDTVEKDIAAAGFAVQYVQEAVDEDIVKPDGVEADMDGACQVFLGLFDGNYVLGE